MEILQTSLAVFALLFLSQVSNCHEIPGCEDQRGTRDYHPMVYIQRSQKCEKLFTQGPCSEGNWLYTDSGLVKCSPNPCQGQGQPGSTVLLNGKCIELNSSCRAGLHAFGTVRFNQGFLPECVPTKAKVNVRKIGKRIVVLSVGGIGPPECPEGYYRTPNGQDCVPLIDIEFD